MEFLLPICFHCGMQLDLSHQEYVMCMGCGEQYPKVLGIADLRKERRPESAFDAAILEKIISAYPNASFLDLLEIWMADQEISREVIDTATRYYQTQHARGSQMIEMFAQRAEELFPPPAKRCALDLGCGVGASFTYLSSQFEQVIGIDLSLISLLLAKKDLEEQGIQNILLIRAQCDKLPFPDKSFNFIVALNVLEHIFIVDEVAAEVHRVLKSGGIFAGDSRNRYDLFLAEPHTHVRWLGFLPRHLAKRYAKWRANNDYDDVCLLSFWQLRSAFQRNFGKDARIVFPRVTAYGYSAKIDQAVRRVEAIPLLRSAAITVFPSHLAIARRSGP